HRLADRRPGEHRDAEPPQAPGQELRPARAHGHGGVPPRRIGALRTYSLLAASNAIPATMPLTRSNPAPPAFRDRYGPPLGTGFGTDRRWSRPSCGVTVQLVPKR